MCTLNYQVCTACDIANKWYLNNTDKYCYQESTLASKTGANLQSSNTTYYGKIVPCVDLKCLNCQANYLICSGCDVSANYFLQGTKCILDTTIQTSYGANRDQTSSTYGKVVPCLETNCTNCQLDYSKCLVCNTTTKNYLDLSSNPNGDCVYFSDIPFGRGADTRVAPATTTPGQVIDCLEPNCDNCKADYSRCVKCDTAKSFYLDTSGKCIAVANITSGNGANLVLGTVVPCSSSNCLDCRFNYTICTKCDTAQLFYLDTSTNACVYRNNITNTYGPNTETGIIVKCSTPHCLTCQESYTICSSCSYSEGWFWNPESLVCVQPPDIGDFFGACLAQTTYCSGPGVVAQCTAEGCLRCQYDANTCTKCNQPDGYFNNTLYDPKGCVLATNIKDYYGADTTTGMVKPCLDSPGCKVCQLNYAICEKCDTSASPPYYLHYFNQNCLLKSKIVDGEGINNALMSVEKCQDPFCLDCRDDYSICKKCNKDLQYYLLADKCVQVNDIENGFGANLFLGIVSPCGLDKCLFCQSDYMTCTGCNFTANYFLAPFGASCVYVTDIKAGYGGNRETGRVDFCEQSQCLLCQYDTTICTKCDLKKDYYLDDNYCFSYMAAPNTFGIDRTTGTLSDCTVAHCRDCQKDNTVCTDCDYMDGYYLEGNVCQKADTGLLLSLNPRKPTNVDLSLILTTAITLPVNQTLFYQSMTPILRMTIIFTSTTTNTTADLSFVHSLTPLESNVQLDISLKEFPPEKHYSVFVKTQKALNVTLEDRLFRVGGTNGTFEYEAKASLTEIAGAQAQGAAVGALMGNNLAITTIIMTAVALDPTGVLMKFNQILKVINKLYFININYGTRLTVFLAQIGGVQTKGDGMEEFLHAKSSRGKFSQAHVTLEFLNQNIYKVILYSFSFIVQMVNYFYLGYKNRCHVNFLKFYYYSLKVHLIIFNLVFIDFIWFGSRNLLHSRGFSIPSYLFTCLILVSLTVDLAMVFNNTMTDRYWRYRMRERRIYEFFAAIESEKMEDEQRLLFTWKRKNKFSKKEVPEELRPPKIVKKDFSGKPVDYEKTLESLYSNSHLFMIMSTTLRPAREVYLNVMPRSLFSFFLLRGIAYQGLILGGSYVTGLTIGLLMVVEIAKIGHSVYCYVKYKYLKNIICLLMEVSQSFFLLLFQIIAMALHPKAFDEIIMDFYQDAGIWIVIASCVAEYLLLITYIAVAAYEFFKNRTLNKRTYAHMNTSFIKYASEPLIETTSPTLLMPTISSPTKITPNPNTKRNDLFKKSMLKQVKAKEITSGGSKKGEVFVYTRPKYPESKKINEGMTFKRSELRQGNDIDIDDDVTNSSMKASMVKGGINRFSALSAKPSAYQQATTPSSNLQSLIETSAIDQQPIPSMIQAPMPNVFRGRNTSNKIDPKMQGILMRMKQKQMAANNH
jgi:hypothetical protein